MFDNNGRAIGSDNPLDIRVNASEVIQPVDVQARYATTIQTHTAAVITPSGTSNGNFASSWIDCAGFDKVGLTLKNDAVTSNTVNLFWSNDGVSIQGGKWSALPSQSYAERDGEFPICGRYLKINIANNDAAPHTFNAWVYLKA